MPVNPVVLNALMLAGVALTNAVVAYITNSLSAQRSDKVAESLAKSNSKQETKLDAIADTSEKTHILVNSQMGDVLKTLVVSAQALYDLKATEENAKLLQQAKDRLSSHESKQIRVDNLPKF